MWRYLPVVIILFGILLRCYRINAPIYDANHVKQTYEAAIARNFYRHGYNIFMPRMDWNYDQPGYLILELPIINFIAALFYAVFGIHEVIGRILAVGFSVGCMYLFYKLCARYFNRNTSLLCLALFAILPYSVYYERVFMTEPVVLFFSVGMVYFLLKWLDKQTGANLAVAGVFGALCFLAKATFLIMLLPASYLIWQKFGKSALRKPAVYIYFATILIPIALWLLHMHIMNAQYAMGHEPLGVAIWKIRGWAEGYSSYLDWWTDPKFYFRVNSQLAQECLSPIGYLLFIIGIFLPVKGKGYLFHFWLAALFVYCLLQPFAITTHRYYALAFVPVAAAFGGRTLGLIFDRSFSNRRVRNIALRILTTATIIAIMCWSWTVLEPRYYPVYKKPLLVGQVIKNLTKPEDLVVFSGWGTHGLSCEYLYASDRRGRQDSLECIAEGQNIDYYVSRGVRYFAVLLSRKELLTDSRTVQFGEYLFKNYSVVAEGDCYTIFNLER